MITDDTVVVNVDPFDMPESQFAAIQAAAGSPAAPSAHDAYMLLGTMTVSTAFCLAIFHHESQYATDPNAIVVNHDTKNPGNCRSSRTGVGTVIMTARGPFVKYPTWPEGWRDLAWRLIDPSYVYVKEGRTTIREIITRFAPVSDNNSPESYIASVVQDMNAWANGGGIVAGDDPRFAWRPDTSEFGYPQGRHGRSGFAIDLGIIHRTAGVNSSGWLRGNNGSSTHYLTDRQMRPLEQHVREADAAWTAGNREYNLRGINVEGELRGDEWTPELIREFARTTYPIWKRNNIPLVYLGRDNGNGKRGLIGHADVPDPDGSGWGGAGNHTDPGSTFSWDLYIAELRTLDGAPPPPDGWPTVPVTEPDPWRASNPYGDGWWIPTVFVAEIRRHDWMLTGYCISEAFAESDKVVQYFERARLELHQDGSITRGLVGIEAYLANYPDRGL